MKRRAAPPRGRLRLRLALALHALLAAAMLLARPAAAASADNLADFDFATAQVERNYAGWEAKTAGTKRAELDALKARLRSDVARGDEATLRQALQQWLSWFDDGHLQLHWAGSPRDIAWRVPRRRLSEAEARGRPVALGASRHPIEGLWSIGDRYRLAVLRRGGNARLFDAVVLSTSADDWAPGDVKAILAARPDGGFTVRYGAGDRTEVALEASLRAGGDVLDLGELGIWRRVHDEPARALSAQRRWPGEDFALTRIGPQTLYLRLPSFNDAHLETLRALLAAHAEELARTPNLVIDVRGNGGGSDFVYTPVLPLLYTRPIWRIGVEMRVSPDNIRLRREVADRLAGVSPDAARALREESERMAAASTPFIRREPPVEIVRFDRVLPNPARIAVLVDRAGSSAENFIMDARQSRKVVLMGQEPSAGVIDHGEMMAMEAPSGRFSVAWATTRSLRLPGDPVDPHGIAPEVPIPADEPDPVAWSARWLEAQGSAFGAGAPH